MDKDPQTSSCREPVAGAGAFTVKEAGPVSWTPSRCSCCVSGYVEPLVLIQLAEQVDPATKQWIMKVMAAPESLGGAGLLAHPGEDVDGDVIVVSAPRCTLLRATEELGLCKLDKDGNMSAFSNQDTENFPSSENMQEFLTLAEKQFIVKHQLETMRAKKDQRIPGLTQAKGVLRSRQGILQKLERAGVIRQVFPLHDQKRLTALGKEWYSKKSLWGQPLDSIQDYFGGPVAFYFSFLDFYTWALVPPAVLGVLLLMLLPPGAASGDQEIQKMVVAGGVPDEEDSPSVSAHMVQAVFSMLWSTIFMELWKRRSSSLSYHWGTFNLTERFAEPRPGFRGELGVNPITGRLEPLFPEWKRQLRMGLGSVPVVGLFLGLVVLGMVGFYHGEAMVKNLHQSSGTLLTTVLLYLPSMLHILYTNMLSTLYQRVALSLTEWENHREESSFQNHHTTKVLVFTFFNCFAVLFHIAFFKQDLPLLRKRLSSLLIVNQLVNQCSEVMIPFIVDRFYNSQDRDLMEDDPEADSLRAQISVPAFPGLFSEYIELLVQFGYLSLFSCIYPLTALLLLINNITEIRGDAYKICRLFRKPFSPPVSNMGVWQAAFEVLGFVSVISNCWLLLLSPRVKLFSLEAGISGIHLLILAILVEHVLILVKMILAFMIPDEPDWVRIKREQIEFNSMQALSQQKN
ncbi:anoctamin-10 isoform X1 [Denticeps clupeoides]|uniref:Anoctamin n=1 Tax=Denticeps clupeoides TaxID=299321 RepID=A0AAY4C3A5_9TELE|nr:anoctamin-10-like isoform X1 [Denticeps clupeoides]